MTKRIVLWSVGEETYFLQMPGGRTERVTGFMRFICLCVFLIFKGYTLREDTQSPPERN